MPMQAPQPAAPAPDQGGGKAMEAIKTIGDSMTALMQGLTESGAPEQLLEPLKESIQYFGEFAAALTGGQAPAEKPEAGMGMADQMASGNKNAQPA